MQSIYIKSIIAAIFSFVCSSYLSAQKHAHTWVGGINEINGAPNNGVYSMRFKVGGIEFDSLPLAMDFESTIGVWSDTSGQLQLVTNGCYISTPDGDTITGSLGLNPGEIHDRTCANNGYISPKGAMFLPMPGQPDQVVLLHMGVTAGGNSSFRYGPFYYSTVQMSDGGGNMTAINVPLLEGDLEAFSAVRHGNGRDWWIIVPERTTARYHTFLLTPQGFQSAVQTVGPPMTCPRLGAGTFSNDGLRYARSLNCKSAVFDFDRCTGQLTNPKVMDRTPHVFGGGSVLFSPDNDQIWVSEQMAIMSANVADAAPQLDTMIYFLEVYPISMGHMQYGPDGNIYIASNHRYGSLSKIDLLTTNTPVFQQKAVTLPFWNVRTIPHVPNFRLFDEANSLCDTLGINAPTTQVADLDLTNELKVFPNPASGGFQIDLRGVEMSGSALQLMIHDTQGKLVRGPLQVYTQHFVELDNITTGLYIVTVQGKEKIHRAKLMVQR
jgi:Secretion system C-terminal sorting domain